MIEVKSKNYLFSLRKTADNKFLHTSKNPNIEGKLSKFLLADCTDPDASRAFGKQTRKIVKTFFENTYVYNQLVDAIKSGTIDETGESAKPLAGYFIDIDCGFTYRSEFNGRAFDSTTVSLFIMEGENFEVVKRRAIRAVEKMRVKTVDDLHVEEDVKQSLDTNKPEPPSGDDDF